MDKTLSKLNNLKKNNANPKEIRTAECDWFGSEEMYALAKAFADSRIEQFYKTILPAEIQVIKTGDWCFSGWPGEIFVEYSLLIKERFDNTFVISLANGELQGYIVTKQAFEEGGYEASNTLLSYESGNLLVKKTVELLNKINKPINES